MVYFATRNARYLLVREKLPGAHRYGREGTGNLDPDPFDDADALEDLGDQIATLAAHIHAATFRLLTLIGEFDRRRGWELGGHRSAAHWLSVRTGIDLGAARERVRAARALDKLPQTSASMARGELSFSKLRALTRVATPDNEADLVDLARGSTAAQLERMVRAFSRGSREDEADLDRIRQKARSFSVFPDDDGMYLVRGRLPAEIGALLMRAVEAASDALFREEWGRDRIPMNVEPATDTPSGKRLKETTPLGAPQASVSAEPRAHGADSEVRGRLLLRETAERNAAKTSRPGSDSEKKAAQRRADAVGLLAERALEAGFRDGPVSGTRAARYQVVLHVDSETLEAEERRGGEKRMVPGRSELEDGTRVSAETSRRISCDAGVVRVTHGTSGSGLGGKGVASKEPPGKGAGVGVPELDIFGSALDDSILDVGRRTRSIPPALRRALEVRDRGCRFPGCGSRFTDAHHVKHWADGGETSLDNCLLLCRHHHRLVHEGGWTVDWWGRGRPVFFDPRGGTHFEGRWKPPKDKKSVSAETLLQDNRRRGIDPDGWTPSARWKREENIPENVLFPALEALCE